eukprot:g35336.t1
MSEEPTHLDVPSLSGNRTLFENLPGYGESILKPIVQGIPSFCRDTTDFLQKFSILIMMDVLELYTSIPHNDGITATALVHNTTNCQFPDTSLQLVRFILDHNIFTFDNQFFIQTHGTAMGTRYAPQYANIFMHSATAKNGNDLLRRQTRDMSDRVSFIVQYIPRTEKLHHVLHSLQHIIDDDEHLAKIFPMSPLLAFKQSPNLKQTIVCSKLPAFSDHNTIQPCHGNLCKTCQIFDMDTTIAHGNTPTNCTADTH